MKLPPLPEPLVLRTVMADDYRYWHVRGFTRSQMLAYGRACAEAERERCARMFDISDGIHGEAEDWCRAAATQMRALKDETP